MNILTLRVENHRHRGYNVSVWNGFGSYMLSFSQLNVVFMLKLPVKDKGSLKFNLIFILFLAVKRCQFFYYTYFTHLMLKLCVELVLMHYLVIM